MGLFHPHVPSQVPLSSSLFYATHTIWPNLTGLVSNSRILSAAVTPLLNGYLRPSLTRNSCRGLEPASESDLWGERGFMDQFTRPQISGPGATPNPDPLTWPLVTPFPFLFRASMASGFPNPGPSPQAPHSHLSMSCAQACVLTDLPREVGSGFSNLVLFSHILPKVLAFPLADFPG